jgi:hypothetical protein
MQAAWCAGTKQAGLPPWRVAELVEEVRAFLALPSPQVAAAALFKPFLYFAFFFYIIGPK